MASTWKIDPSHSAVEFSVRHLMITTVKGRFADVEGSVTVTGATPDSASVEVTVKTASIDTRTEQRDQHLRSPDFLDVETYPTMTFKSTSLEGERDRFTLVGDLTLHGVTKPLTLDVTFEGEGKDPWGGDRMGFSATGKVDRREYGLTYNQALEAGGVVVGHDIKLQFEVQLVKAA